MAAQSQNFYPQSYLENAHLEMAKLEEFEEL